MKTMTFEVENKQWKNHFTGCFAFTGRGVDNLRDDRFFRVIQSDGQYSFNNTTGQIILQVPQSSSFTVQVVSQQRNFSSNLPIKVVTKDVYSPSMQRVVGQCGDGEASVKVQNQNGVILIKKLD